MIPAPLMLASSRWEKRWLYLSHAFAALACVFSPWLWGMALLVAFSLYRHLHAPASLVCGLAALPDGSVRLTLSDGKEADAELLSSSRVLGMLMVLHFTCEARRINLVLWPDSAPAEVLRQWRVWLRWQWPLLQKKAGQDPQ